MKSKINFTDKFPISTVFSALLVLSALVLMFTKGPKYGVDFRGGAEIQVKFAKDIGSKDIREILKNAGVKHAVVQGLGEKEEREFLVKVQADENELNHVTQEISNILESSAKDFGVEVRKTDIVGPKAGEELRYSGLRAMVYAILAIMIYIWLRFDFKYSPGAIVALTHDVIIILGIFVVMEKEFTLQIVASLLAVIGYSVNDTVVIYDRVRKHELQNPQMNLKDHIDNAVNETLTRTFLTSGTTLFVSIAMFVWGGGSIHDFFFAISLGVVIGTYSSIFIAAPVTLFLNRFKPSIQEEVNA